jgi:hypothetical protein
MRQGVTELRGLQEVKLEVGPRKMPIDEVTEDDLQALTRPSRRNWTARVANPAAVYPAAQDRVSDHRVRSKEIRPPAVRAAAALVPLAACMQHHLVGRQRPSASDQRASRITLKREERPLGRWRLEFNGAFDWLEMMTTCPCRNGTCGLTSWRHADRAQDHRSGDRARFAKPP